MKRKKHINLFIVVLLYPYIVSFSPDGADTSWTEFRFGIGSGSFTKFTRDCSGNIVGAAKIPMKDISMAYDHQENHFRYGAAAGYFSTGEAAETDVSPERHGEPGGTFQARHGWYVNPSAGIHWKYFGIDAGGVITDVGQPKTTILPGGRIRFGDRDGLFLSGSVLNNLPIATGGGFADLGFGYNFDRPGSSIWFGACIGPYHEVPQAIAYSFKYDAFISSNLFLNFRTQYAKRNLGYIDHGVAFGGGIIF
jgi:hypothetical protein